MAIRSVLIANRGEIAVRIMRTLSAMGIRGVAIHSRADAGALHTRSADIAVPLEASADRADATGGYLSIDAIVRIAVEQGCDAVHPGYGFLAENAEFARACAAAGVEFIGPGPEAIEALGDKAAARDVAVRAGVPIVPGIELQVDAAAAEVGGDIGYPVLVKPVAGGGGKGMHVAADAGELEAVLPRARREALAAFGDDRLIIERYLPRARHIEVQVLADAAGNVRAIGDRECTLQRRHQKVIEEAPAPNLPETVRARIHSAAEAVVREVGYRNAGTVEFVVSADDASEFYFLEVNTRLQVEHPVTEEVLGIDLVRCQLRIAEGGSLQSLDLPAEPSGHAFEARIYAEDPDHGFLPTGGRLEHWRMAANQGLRVDAAVTAGDVVGSSYDPMIAKVITHAPTREAARVALVDALRRSSILGVVTNTGFLIDLLGAGEVAAAAMDTRFIERFMEEMSASASHGGAGIPARAIAAWAISRAEAAASAARSSHLPASWSAADSWRLSAPAMQMWRGAVDGAPVLASVAAGDDGLTVATAIGGAESTSDVREVSAGSREFSATIDGEHIVWDAVRCADAEGEHWWIGIDGRSWVISSRQALRSKASAGGTDPSVRSPMPGTVVRVDVAVGDSVAAGQALASVEAMKMEHALTAPHDGVVSEVACSVGAHVKLREVLLVVEPAS